MCESSNFLQNSDKSQVESFDIQAIKNEDEQVICTLMNRPCSVIYQRRRDRLQLEADIKTYNKLQSITPIICSSPIRQLYYSAIAEETNIQAQSLNLPQQINSNQNLSQTLLKSTKNQMESPKKLSQSPDLCQSSIIISPQDQMKNIKTNSQKKLSRNKSVSQAFEYQAEQKFQECKSLLKKKIFFQVYRSQQQEKDIKENKKCITENNEQEEKLFDSKIKEGLLKHGKLVNEKINDMEKYVKICQEIEQDMNKQEKAIQTKQFEKLIGKDEYIYKDKNEMEANNPMAFNMKQEFQDYKNIEYVAFQKHLIVNDDNDQYFKQLKKYMHKRPFREQMFYNYQTVENLEKKAVKSKKLDYIKQKRLSAIQSAINKHQCIQISGTNLSNENQENEEQMLANTESQLKQAQSTSLISTCKDFTQQIEINEFSQSPKENEQKSQQVQKKQQDFYENKSSQEIQEKATLSQQINIIHQEQPSFNNQNIQNLIHQNELKAHNQQSKISLEQLNSSNVTPSQLRITPQKINMSEFLSDNVSERDGVEQSLDNEKYQYIQYYDKIAEIRQKENFVLDEINRQNLIFEKTINKKRAQSGKLKKVRQSDSISKSSNTQWLERMTTEGGFDTSSFADIATPSTLVIKTLRGSFNARPQTAGSHTRKNYSHSNLVQKKNIRSQSGKIQHNKQQQQQLSLNDKFNKNLFSQQSKSITYLNEEQTIQENNAFQFSSKYTPLSKQHQQFISDSQTGFFQTSNKYQPKYWHKSSLQNNYFSQFQPTLNLTKISKRQQKKYLLRQKHYQNSMKGLIIHGSQLE